MAMRSNGPILLSLPAFRGVTRRLILLSLMVFFAVAFLSLLFHDMSGSLLGSIVLVPQQALHWHLWQFLSYPFADLNLISVALALLSLWFFGSTLGGGWLASLLTMVADDRIDKLSVDSIESGMWPFVLALVLAYAYFHADQPLRFNFIFTLKAKYLAAIYLLFYLGAALYGGNRFSALVALCNALCGYAYLRLAPRRSLKTSASESWFGLRNAYIRAKRRRAAKKFTVYMRRQGKDVNLDPSGRYVDPDGNPRDPHNLNDKRWMN